MLPRSMCEAERFAGCPCASGTYVITDLERFDGQLAGTKCPGVHKIIATTLSVLLQLQ